MCTSNGLKGVEYLNEKDRILGGYLSRQEVAFREECRKIKGCGSLREDFYTRFIPIFKDFVAVTWLMS